MRKVGVVTVARSDYGYLRPVLTRIKSRSDLDLRLIVAGMHLSPEFGLSVRDIEADGFEIAARVEMLISGDTPTAIGTSIGVGTAGFSQVFSTLQLDILLLLGDRFEMLAAGCAMLPFAVPIAHIAGGETTEGAIDESIRHALTKMSHLHFVATEAYGRRVIQMGEEPWRVTVTGSPSLDNVHEIGMCSKEEASRMLGFSIDDNLLLITFHPVTLEYESTANQIDELLAALEGANRPSLFTYPNADTNGRLIIQKIENYVASHSNAHVVRNLGQRLYFSLLGHVGAMVGNSSSGIIEAATFELPVVNIGKRQAGRIRERNVIDVEPERQEIASAIEKAVSTSFRRSLNGLKNPYGDGSASDRIVRRLEEVSLDSILIKKFHDLGEA